MIFIEENRMTADSTDELKKFVNSLGMESSWIHIRGEDLEEPYITVKGYKKRKALQSGAIEIKPEENENSSNNNG